MGNIVVVGGQWGDEGKGKIVDLLTEHVDVCARYGGGNNAGHTVKIGEETYPLHLIPSGVLRRNVVCVLGNGMVVNPGVLVGEMEKLMERGVEIIPERLLISDRAHIILPVHELRDGNSTSKKIGTTGRGIGPAYADKADRIGLRFAEAQSPQFAELLAERVSHYNAQFPLWQFWNWKRRLSVAKTVDSVQLAVRPLLPYVTNTEVYLHKAWQDGKRILLESAQGTLLDIDHGTYPFVTSSNPTIGGALTGTSLPPQAIDEIIGIVKAYTTRVGGGPFPTRMKPELEERVRKVGTEYGTTTGRPRNCGWLDIPQLRRAVRINGLTSIALTKLDVLGGIDELKLCMGYTLRGKRIEEPPTLAEDLEAATPIYETLPGFGNIAGCTEYDKLQPNAKRYVARLEKLLGVPIDIISTGPARSETIVRKQFKYERATAK